MGNSSSKPSSVESHWSKRITQTKLEERRRNYSDTPDATTNALSLITGPFQQSRSPVNSIFSTNKASAPPPYSATAENTGDNRNVYAPTISKPGSAPQVSSTLEPANRSSRQARATTPHALGSQHTQVYMVPADARDVEYLQKPMPRESVENVLEILCRYDTVVIVDDSSSMKGALWNEVCAYWINIMQGELNSIGQRCAGFLSGHSRKIRRRWDRRSLSEHHAFHE